MSAAENSPTLQDASSLQGAWRVGERVVFHRGGVAPQTRVGQIVRVTPSGWARVLLSPDAPDAEEYPDLFNAPDHSGGAWQRGRSVSGWVTSRARIERADAARLARVQAECDLLVALNGCVRLLTVMHSRARVLEARRGSPADLTRALSEARWLCELLASVQDGTLADLERAVTGQGRETAA